MEKIPNTAEIGQEKREMVNIFLTPPQNETSKKSFIDLAGILSRNELSGKVSRKTGLKWCKDLIVKHSENTADWEGLDTIIADYGKGKYAVSTIIHEMLHLILRQNNWLSDPTINLFVKKHPELSVGKRGEGYLIEQMAAYLLQRDILRGIGELENDDTFLEYWDEDHFKEIIKGEYSKSEWLKKFGTKMIEMWDVEDKDIMNWFRSVCID